MWPTTLSVSWSRPVQVEHVDERKLHKDWTRQLVQAGQLPAPVSATGGCDAVYAKCTEAHEHNIPAVRGLCHNCS